MLRLVRYFTVSWLASALWAMAQEGSTRVQFLAFPHQSDPEPLELLVGEHQSMKIHTPGNVLSQPYTVPALSAFVVGKMTRSAENKDVFEKYGSGTALPAKKQIVLLLRKGENQKDGFVVIPVDAMETNFKAASYLFINASNYSVGAVIGDQKFALKPTQRKLVQPKPNHQDDICQVTFSYLLGERWKTVYDTRWPANDKFRSIVFFFQNPETGRLGIAPIMDVLPYKP